MKNKIQVTISKSLLILLVAFNYGCNNDITERNNQFPQLTPANPDELAGAWKPILLTSPDEFSLEAPIATTLAAYTREIIEIKSYQASITKQQQAIIAYWSAGGVLRWNEIMRTLVAKHNRPPYQNPDGTYPIPSGANPF